MLDFSGVAVEEAKTAAVGMGTLAGLRLRERIWGEAAACVAALELGEITWGKLSSSQVSAYERFKEAGEDIGGVRTLMELVGDSVGYWLVFHKGNVSTSVVSGL